MYYSKHGENVFFKQVKSKSLNGEFKMSDLILTDNTFGVEIETASPVSRERLATILEEKTNLPIYAEGYNHRDSETNWKIVSDATIRTTNSCPNQAEIVSPILKGEAGLQELEKMLTALNEVGVIVNKSCGIHVHHDANMLNTEQMIKLSQFYTFYETILDSLQPMSRRAHNSYNTPMKQNSEHSSQLFDRIESRKSMNDWIARERNDSAKRENMRLAFAHQFARNCKLNIYSAYGRHETIEFRHHSSSTEFLKIKNWIILTQAMMKFASNNRKKLSKNHKPTFAKMFKLLEVSKKVEEFYTFRRLILRDKYFSFNSGCTKQDAGYFPRSRPRSAGSRCFLDSANNGTLHRYLANQNPECEGDFDDEEMQLEREALPYTFTQAVSN